MHNVMTVYAHAYRNIRAILMLDVALNVYSAQNVPRTKLVSGISVRIHAREHAVKTLYVVSLIIYQSAVVQTV